MSADNQNPNIEYYFDRHQIGLFVLFNSLKEQTVLLYDQSALSLITGCELVVISDWIFIFNVLERLKVSLSTRSRWDIALDATSFFLFIRIYYDSIGNVIHYFFKAMNPDCSQRWPRLHSFSDQLKWFDKKSNDSYFADYVDALEYYGFAESFKKMRTIRNRLKTAPKEDNFDRMLWPSKDLFPITGNLRNEIGYYLYQVLRFTDFLGDYFGAKISESIPIKRLETDYHGQEIGFLHNDHLEIYKWFNDTKIVNE